MSGSKKPPSTALATTDGRLPEELARRMYDWRRAFCGPLPLIFIRTLSEDALLIETLDGTPLGDGSFLAVETLTNRVVGVIRDGALDALPDRIPPSRTRCTLFPAAQA